MVLINYLHVHKFSISCYSCQFKTSEVPLKNILLLDNVKTDNLNSYGRSDMEYCMSM